MAALSSSFRSVASYTPSFLSEIISKITSLYMFIYFSHLLSYKQYDSHAFRMDSVRERKNGVSNHIPPVHLNAGKVSQIGSIMQERFYPDENNRPDFLPIRHRFYPYWYETFDIALFINFSNDIFINFVPVFHAINRDIIHIFNPSL